MAFARETPNSPNKTRDGSWELLYSVDGTIDEVEAIEAVYRLNPPLIFRGQPRRPGESLRWTSRGIAEVILEFGPLGSSGDDDTPSGELPTLATLQIKGAGATFHTSQCLTQVAYPEGKGTGIVDCKAVGLHRDGVNGVDIHVSGSQYMITCRWLPAVISGAYIDGLDDLQGKTNQNSYELRWGFDKKLYSLTCEPGELLFTDYDCKTTFTRAGIGVWEFSYSMIRIKTRNNIDLGKNKAGAPIIVKNKRGHEYLWVWYSRKEIADPAVYIEVPELAFVSRVYEEEDFKKKLGF